MTRKDYVLIAEAIRRARAGLGPATPEVDFALREVVSQLCNVLRGNNPAFKFGQFWDAALGVSPPSET